MGGDTIQAVLRDWRTAPVSERLRAALGFVEKLTLRPDEVGPDDASALRRAGLSDEAIEDAGMVCALFTTYVRLADTFEFDIPTAEGFKKTARTLLAMGYRFPPPIAWMVRRAVARRSA